MFRTKYIRLLVLAAAAFAAACTADPDFNETSSADGLEGAEPASLTVEFSIADIGIDVSTRADAGGDAGIDVSTRADAGAGDLGGSEGGNEGGSSEPAADPTPALPTFELSGSLPAAVVKYLDPDKKWTAPTDTAEKNFYNDARSINGSVMTCLTVILIHRHSNRIVGIRQIPDPDCSFKPAAPDLNNTIGVINAEGKFELGEILWENDVVGSKVRAVVGTHARVTFDYENPGHVVDEEFIEYYADLIVGTPAANGKTKAQIIEANQQYVGESSERLTRGEYTILAIANYDHSVTTSTVQAGSTGGIYQTVNVNEVLKGIAGQYHTPQVIAEGMGPFNPNYSFLYDMRFLMNRALQNIGDVNGDGVDEYNVIPILGTDNKQIKPFIRPAVHQTLTAASEFYLTAGDNQMELKLQRISSRTRVEVRNYSPTSDLKVHELGFSKNYTQSTSYLFRRNKNDRDFSELTDGRYKDHDGKGAPMVGYTGIAHTGDDPTYGAIVPFIFDHDFDGKNGADGVIVEPNSKKCIFDALMYETSVDYKDTLDENEEPDPDELYYTIDVSYPSVTEYTTPDIDKIDYDKWVADGKQTVPDPDRVSFEYANAKGETVPAKVALSGLTSAQDIINAIVNIEKSGEHVGCCFLLQGLGQKKRFVYEHVEDPAKSGAVYAYENGDVNLDTQGIDLKSFLWQLDGMKDADGNYIKDADGNYRCYLKNLRSGEHMPTLPQCVAPTPPYGQRMHVTDDTDSQKYILGLSKVNDTGENNVTFANYFNPAYSYTQESKTSYYNYAYLSIWGPEEKYLSGWHTADQGCQFKLYPVKIIPRRLYKGTPRVRKTIKLTAFSDETAVVEPVREIKRNDFVRILVEVSYNPQEGDFNFQVVPWVKKSGSVSFH